LSDSNNKGGRIKIQLCTQKRRISRDLCGCNTPLLMFVARGRKDKNDKNTPLNAADSYPTIWNRGTKQSNTPSRNEHERTRGEK
jgi:hypothetical protein